MKCTNCSKELPQGLPSTIEFCPFCGQKLGLSKCPKCGKPLVKDAVYCYKCGTTLESSPTREAPSEPPYDPFNSLPQEPEKHYNQLQPVDNYPQLFEKKWGMCKSIHSNYVTNNNQRILNVVENWSYGGTSKYSPMSQEEISECCCPHYNTSELGGINSIAVCKFTYNDFYSKGNLVFTHVIFDKELIITAPGNVCSMFYCDGILAVTTIAGLENKGYHQEEWMQGDYGEYYYEYDAKLDTSFYKITQDPVTYSKSATLLNSFKGMSAVRSGCFLKNHQNTLRFMDYDGNIFNFDIEHNNLTKFCSAEKFIKEFPFSKHHFSINGHLSDIVWYSGNGDKTELLIWDDGKIKKLLPEDEPQKKWEANNCSPDHVDPVKIHK